MPSRSLADLDPELSEKYLLLAEDFASENPGKRLMPVCTWRSLDEQAQLYAAKKTQLMRGLHNLVDGDGDPCSRAIDVAVVDDGKITWDASAYAALGPLAARHGLEWGGAWTTLKDLDHLQLPT